MLENGGERDAVSLCVQQLLRLLILAASAAPVKLPKSIPVGSNLNGPGLRGLRFIFSINPELCEHRVVVKMLEITSHRSWITETSAMLPNSNLKRSQSVLTRQPIS